MKLSEKNIRKLKQSFADEILKNKNSEDLARLGGLGVDLITMVCSITADTEKKAIEGVDVAMRDCKKRIHVLFAALGHLKGEQYNVKN
jgi:hypothetical protein